MGDGAPTSCCLGLGLVGGEVKLGCWIFGGGLLLVDGKEGLVGERLVPGLGLGSNGETCDVSEGANGRGDLF